MPANKNQLTWNATVKAYPAVSDLQAIETFVRISDTKLNVGPGAYNQDVYTVPAGKIFVQQYLMARSAQGDPTFIDFVLRSGVTSYGYYTASYGAAWEQHRWVTEIMYDEAEIVRIQWSGTLATTDVYATLFGYLIPKY